MSGIAGIYNLDGRPVDRVLLRRMTDAMAYRGPDSVGHWIRGPIGLGHRMLHATPEMLLERQPLPDERETICLTFDGRLDNREEIKTALEAQGVTLRNDADAELVLRVYEIWGEDCPKRMLGDFAFAIWDSRNHRLFCARDPLGMRCMYYHVDGDTFLFASEIQPLFEEGRLQRRPNLPLLGLYLLNWFDEREQTLYEGIYRLPAAHSLTVENGTVRKAQYWDVDPTRTVRYRTDADYAEHFLSLFGEAVRARLRSHGPVAVSLSGGLDSSSVACTARKLYKENALPDTGLETFSILFDTFPCDERTYIGEIVRKCGVKTNFVTYEQLDPSLFGLEQAHQYPDVFYEPTRLMYIPALTDLHHRGIKVFLDGIGGDELLAAGFDHLTDLMRAHRFNDLFRQLRQDADIYATPPFTLFLKYCLGPMVPRPLKDLLRPLARPFREDCSSSLIDRPFLKAWDLESRLNTGVEVPKFPTRSQQVIYNGLFFGWNALAREMNELFTARFSVECRSPFLDRRLVEFLLAVPEEQRWRGDQPKFILRQAMAGILPEGIRSRKGKAEFSACIDQELMRRRAQTVETIFHNSILVGLGILNRDRFLRLFTLYRKGTRQYLTGIIELVVELELWCRVVMGISINGRQDWHEKTHESGERKIPPEAPAVCQAGTH